jgi:hypothetical protein
MGDIVSQDRAYTIKVPLALIEVIEEEWQTFYLQISVFLMSTCMFLLVYCIGGMRGFEVVWTDLAALRYMMSPIERLRKMTLRSPGLLWKGLRLGTGSLTVI